MASLFQKTRATRYKTGLSRSGRSRNERKYSRDYHEDESNEESGGAPRNSTVDNKQKKNDNTRETTEDYQLEEDIYSDIDSHDEQSVSSADLANNNTNNLSNREQRRRRRWTHPEAHFKQKYAPCSTIFCIAQCIILFLMMWQCGIAPLNINPMLGPGPDVLNYWGAKNAVLIIDDDEDWRLITPIFLHAGLIHLAGNVMVQIDAGNTWEKEWGSFIWMIIYIGSAFGSSVFSTCFMPDNISVGSSGAVMGLFGGKLAEILLLCCEKSTNLKELAGERSRKQQVCLVVGGIVLVALMSFIPYVDWAGE
jgi:membrane associated rhomboid family serine protease